MIDLKADLVPVLLGADLNCYSVARAFYEQYGVVSQAFGKYPLGVTSHSRFVRFVAIPHLDNPEICIDVLRDFAKKNEEKILILMGCTDEYAEFIIDFKERLEDCYIMPYTDKALKDKLVDKADFYQMCEEFGISYPKTVTLDAVCDESALSPEALGFSYPIIVKPSSSIEYWRHPFEKMEKVYFANDASEAHSIISTIYSSGYDRTIILQDTIPGSDSKMRVFTVYMDKNAKAKMLCLGHVLLEEHTPRGRGNHAAIITENPPPICEKLVGMLEGLGYTGFANFDIKYDERDGEYKVFEINIRQGRSNHYITASGINIASLVVRDRILEEDMPKIVQDKEFFWHSVPRGVVYSYTDSEELVEKCKSLCREGKEGSPFICRYDLRFNPLRIIFVTETLRRQFGKYAKHCRKMR